MRQFIHVAISLIFCLTFWSCVKKGGEIKDQDMQLWTFTDKKLGVVCYSKIGRLDTLSCVHIPILMVLE